MVFFNWATMQMAAKIVYYGPGLCGKTSNLSCIYAKTSPNSRGEMVSLETESDRTLFFDLLPIEVGTIGGFKTRLQLYTVPGQVFYNTTRKLVLKGVDGVVFVADSQRPMREANIESLTSLRSNIEELGVDFSDLPLVLQYNKRDLKNTLSLEELNADLNHDLAFSFFESEAINGVGVFETLKEITKLTLKKLRRRMVAPHGAPAGPRQPSSQVRVGTPSPPRPAAVSAAALIRAAEEGVEANPGAPAAAEVARSTPPPTAPHSSTPSPPAPGDPFQAPEAEAAAPEQAPDDGIVRPPDDAEVHGGEPFAMDPDQSEAMQSTDDEPSAAPSFSAPVDEESDVKIEFDQTGASADEASPPEMKRVQVSNQMDILAELEGLRKQATMDSFERHYQGSGSDLDIDALLAGSESTRELRRRVEQALNSDIFRNMGALQLAVRIQDVNGETIHTLEPVSLAVNKAGKLQKLSLRFTLDLENHQ